MENRFSREDALVHALCESDPTDPRGETKPANVVAGACALHPPPLIPAPTQPQPVPTPQVLTEPTLRERYPTDPRWETKPASVVAGAPPSSHLIIPFRP